MNHVLGAINNFPQSFRNYCYETQQAGLSAILKLKEMRSNPDIYQKIGQLTSASLQLITMMNRASPVKLTELSLVISAAVGMHDFYRVIQYPRNWFRPINAEKINEKAVVKDLAWYLASQFSDAEELLSKEQYDAFYSIAQKCVKAQLQLMATKDDAYQTLDEFMGQVEKHLRKVKSEDFDFTAVDLSGLTQSEDCDVANWIRHVPTFEKLTDMVWAVADVLTDAFWLGVSWKMVNLAKCAETVGQFRAFEWVKNQHLETCLIGSICTGYGLQLLESVRKLRDDALTPIEKSQAKWNAVTSVANLAFFGSMFTNMIGKTQINNMNVQILAIGARSFGLLSLLAKPKREFFEVS